MALNRLSFTLLPLVMCFSLPGRFPSQTTPSFLMLKEKSNLGVSLSIIKKNWRPHTTQKSCRISSWWVKANWVLISWNLLPHCTTATVWGRRETKKQGKGGDSPPLPPSCKTHLEYCVQLWGLQCIEDTDFGARGAVKMLRGWSTSPMKTH